jgi:hypothetical protein
VLAVGEGEALTPSALSFDVSGSGEATWDLPLWMPEGRNDIAPKLAISHAIIPARVIDGLFKS